MDSDVHRLVLLGAGGRIGQNFELSGDYMTLGRSSSNDIVLSDSTVSRMHASISRKDGYVYIQDLGSSAGTAVNGRPLTGALRLRSGDVITAGMVKLEYEHVGEPSSATALLPAQRSKPEKHSESPSQARYDIDNQHAHTISNIGGNQYIKHIRQERESFLREVAATRTKARWVIWIGVTLFIVGFAMFAGSVLQFMNWIIVNLRNPSGRNQDITLPESIMSPVVFVGWAMAAAGSILIVIGIVLHIVATSRRRRIDREHPLPPRRNY